MLFAFLSFKQQFIARIVALIDRAVEFKMLSLHAERVADIALAAAEPVQGLCRRPGHARRDRNRAAATSNSATPSPILSFWTISACASAKASRWPSSARRDAARRRWSKFS